ncbi:MAG: hypothetical protein R3F17_13145 [Planctomycetota bacterium]
MGGRGRDQPHAHCRLQPRDRERNGAALEGTPSNFRIEGFTEEVSGAELAELGRARGIPVAWDLGSGRIEAPPAPSLDPVGAETIVRDAVASGVDVVTFSGDKLLGGPQAGLLVGRADAIAALRRCPLYRALRLDKVALAGLERTAELLLEGRGGELPTRAMLCAGEAQIAQNLKEMQAALQGVPRLRVEVRASTSMPGSGSAPTVELPTTCLVIEVEGYRATELAAGLRRATPPVFTRVQDDRVWLDPRCLLPGDLPGLRHALFQLTKA